MGEWTYSMMLTAVLSCPVQVYTHSFKGGAFLGGGGEGGGGANAVVLRKRPHGQCTSLYAQTGGGPIFQYCNYMRKSAQVYMHCSSLQGGRDNTECMVPERGIE